MRGTRSTENLRDGLHASAEFIWHDSTDLSDVDAVILPGGFSYGDYLRCGAIARFSPVMNAVKKFAADGGLVLGICNGFQILVEAGLAPRRAAAQSGSEIHLPRSHSAHGNHQLAVHLETCRRASCCTCRSRTAKAAISPTNARSMSSKPKTAWRSATWIIRTARSATSPAF